MGRAVFLWVSGIIQNGYKEAHKHTTYDQVQCGRLPIVWAKTWSDYIENCTASGKSLFLLWCDVLKHMEQ